MRTDGDSSGGGLVKSSGGQEMAVSCGGKVSGPFLQVFG